MPNVIYKCIDYLYRSILGLHQIYTSVETTTQIPECFHHREGHIMFKLTLEVVRNGFAILILKTFHLLGFFRLAI